MNRCRWVGCKNRVKADGIACHLHSKIERKRNMMTSKKYQTIYADPPWPIKWNASQAIGKKHIEYPTMPISEICALPVHEIADANCTLFMWTTNAYLPESLGVLRHWRFQYKMLFTWCKNNGMGGHPRNATEHMIIATRGEPESDRHASATLNWIEHPRIGHSVKPEVFRETIERISPGPRIELFARKRVEGWDAWGNEVESDIDLTDTDGSTMKVFAESSTRKYDELLFAVGRKFPNENRHETALRYIREAEKVGAGRTATANVE